MIHKAPLSIFTLLRESITVSPALACIPMMFDVAKRLRESPKPEQKKAAAEMQAEHDALIASLDELGIKEPLKCYHEGGEKWIAVDGRHRLDWATVTHKEFVPVIEITKEEADKVIEASVIGRRHWTKGQRAWLGVLQHPEVCEIGKGRPADKSDSVGFITATALATRLGVSADVVNQAVTLYRAFYAPGVKKKSPESIEAAAKREKYEHLIWGGAGLGAIIAGIGGGDATGGKPKGKTGFHHLDAPLGALSRLGKHWMEWSPEERTKAQQLIVARIRGDGETKGWPEEFRMALAEALTAADADAA